MRSGALACGPGAASTHAALGAPRPAAPPAQPLGVLIRPRVRDGAAADHRPDDRERLGPRAVVLGAAGADDALGLDVRVAVLIDGLTPLGQGRSECVPTGFGATRAFQFLDERSRDVSVGIKEIGGDEDLLHPILHRF